MKPANEVRELQRQKMGAYEKAKEITDLISKQAESKPLVFVYTFPEPINIHVRDILEEMGYDVQAKKDEITHQTVTEIKW